MAPDTLEIHPCRKSGTEVQTQPTYEPPTIQRLTPEQARSLFTAHANTGDQAAADLLEALTAPVK